MSTEIQSKEDFYNLIFSTSGIEEKKRLLKSFSKTAKQMLEEVPGIAELYSTVNEVILNTMYKNEEHTEFNTFKGWKEKGFKVVRGSKSFFIWSKPRKFEKENEEGKKDEYEFFGIANLFSNHQVEPIQ
jgi:excinuclease UvrABC ATPase subunit